MTATVSSTALDSLRDLIRETCAPRDRLPPERELAGTLGISRGALRQALAQLEAEGVIWRHVGRGTFVGRRPLGSGSGEGGALFSPDTTNPQEVMEARLILEPRLCALAAHRATPAQIARMEACLRNGASAEDVASFERWDGALHRSLAEAAGNGLLSEVYQAIDGVRDQELWGRLKKKSATEARRRQYVEQHEAVVGAIRDRDAEAAERHMRTHLITVCHNMLGMTYP